MNGVPGSGRAVGSQLTEIGTTIVPAAQGVWSLSMAARALMPGRNAVGSAAERGTVGAAPSVAKSPQVARIQSILSRYPLAIDLRTGRQVHFPTDVGSKIPKSDRAVWGATERGEFIAEWHRRGYSTPRGGWAEYDVHHIKPLEYGGQNDFWNLTPIPPQTHKDFNAFWRNFTGL